MGTLRFFSFSAKSCHCSSMSYLLHSRHSSSPSFFSSSSSIVESVAYRRSMLRKPGTVSSNHVHRNSCSFIGRVMRPVKLFNESYVCGDAYTFIKVKAPTAFEILLVFRDVLAQMSLKYVKLTDLIFIRGYLDSYVKENSFGSNEIFYKVIVIDLNHIREINKNPTLEMPDNSEHGNLVKISHTSCESKEYSDRLHLWQVFFSNPTEWWDNRRTKRQSTGWDFRHKDTGEGLRLEADDPPWLRTQLELYDSKMASREQHYNLGSLSNALGWKDTDFKWK